MGSLQLNRGNLADKPTLAEGEAYFAQDKDLMIAKINGGDKCFWPALKEPDIKVVAGTIPAVPTASRSV